MLDQLRDKMIDYTVPPPPAAWGNIDLRLNDDQNYAELSARMKQLEINPPSKSFDRIFSTPGIQYAIKTNTPVRQIVYRIAVAAIIAVVLVFGWMIVSTGVAVTGLATKINIPVVPKAGDKNNNGADRNAKGLNGAAAITDTNDAAVYALKGSASFMGAALNENVLRYALISKREVFHPVSRIKAPPLPDKKNLAGIGIALLFKNNRYLVIEGPGGELTRISAKFTDVIHLLNNKEKKGGYTEQLDMEAATWQQRFQEWRTKVSESYIPASANFFDILALKDLIANED